MSCIRNMEKSARPIAARTAEDIGMILTRERLLQSIREKMPESRSELAGILKHSIYCSNLRISDQ